MPDFIIGYLESRFHLKLNSHLLYTSYILAFENCYRHNLRLGRQKTVKKHDRSDTKHETLN